MLTFVSSRYESFMPLSSASIEEQRLFFYVSLLPLIIAQQQSYFTGVLFFELITISEQRSAFSCTLF